MQSWCQIVLHLIQVRRMLLGSPGLFPHLQNNHHHSNVISDDWHVAGTPKIGYVLSLNLQESVLSLWTFWALSEFSVP